MNRRSFLAASGSAALSFSVLSAQNANAHKVKLGLIGCGGRGVWITNLFQKHGGYEIYACADYFQDRVDACGEKFGIPAERRFPRLSGYKQLLECGVDAVAIESPPYFHPQQAAEAVAAGLHVYLAKPIAVDVPGCQSVAQSGRLASQKGLCFLVDFQTRANAFYMEAIKRVHDGALGDMAFGEATYHAGIPWGGHMKALAADPDNPEVRLRAWGMSQVLSGDIITEQNIHTLDVMSWIMKSPPLYAVGTGGRKVRPLGDCYDHFTCLYQYPDNVGVTFSSRQFDGHGSLPEGIRNRVFGSEGTLETAYGDLVIIRGKNFYRGGKTSGIYAEGAVNNIASFHRDITEGRAANDTVAPSVQSNLITILGRMAAYKQRTVTWQELEGSTEQYTYDVQGLKV
jgi:predicted dehydrogenase